MLSDHVFSFFGRTFTITRYEQFAAVLIVCIVAAVWAVQQFRRRRVVILHRSAVSDQLLYELSRIADSLDRLSNHPADQVIAAANLNAEESRTIPLSLFGRERPHS